MFEKKSNLGLADWGTNDLHCHPCQQSVGDAVRAAVRVEEYLPNLN